MSAVIIKSGITLICSLNDSYVLSNLVGKIYYTKRVGGVNTLYKADASLSDEELLYSYKNKVNANILNFYFDSSNGNLDVEVYGDGRWEIHSMKKDAMGNWDIYDRQATDFESMKVEYINKVQNGIKVYQEKGSIYISKDNEEECVKRFIGIYDMEFTGYRIHGLSPDGKYLVYSSMEHMTVIGVLLDSILTKDVGKTYIMDIETKRVARFVDASKIQWTQ